MAESWIGGDFVGLQSMGHSLTGARQQLQDVVKPLDSGVDSLVGDAGWQGDAAETFRGKWVSDSITAGAYADLVGSVGQVLTDLGNHLESMNAALQNAADVAQGKGVQLGPLGEAGQMMTSNPPSAADQKAITALNEYSTVYEEITHSAQQARLQAGDALNKLFAELSGKAEGITTTDGITVGDFLRSLWTLDAEKLSRSGKQAKTELDSARAAEDQAKRAWRAERKVFEKQGKRLPKAFAPHDAYKAAMAKVDELNQTVTMSENASDRLPLDRELNYKLSDALDGLKALDKLPDFLRDVPVVDIGAAVVGGGLEAKQDHDEGWSWNHSLAVDVGGALVGVAAGAAIGVAGVAGLEAAGFTLGVTAEVSSVAVVGVGVGYLADHLFHEHWSEDIHNHGVAAGLLHGTMHSVNETGKNMWGAVMGIGHSIENVF